MNAEYSGLILTFITTVYIALFVFAARKYSTNKDFSKRLKRLSEPIRAIIITPFVVVGLALIFASFFSIYTWWLMVIACVLAASYIVACEVTKQKPPNGHA